MVYCENKIWLYYEVCKCILYTQHQSVRHVLLREFCRPLVATPNRNMLKLSKGVA